MCVHCTASLSLFLYLFSISLSSSLSLFPLSVSHTMSFPLCLSLCFPLCLSPPFSSFLLSLLLSIPLCIPNFCHSSCVSVVSPRLDTIASPSLSLSYTVILYRSKCSCCGNCTCPVSKLGTPVRPFIHVLPVANRG